MIDSTWVTRIEQGVDISGQPTGEPKFRGVASAHYKDDLGGDAGLVFLDATYSYTSRQRENGSTRFTDCGDRALRRLLEARPAALVAQHRQRAARLALARRQGVGRGLCGKPAVPAPRPHVEHYLGRHLPDALRSCRAAGLLRRRTGFRF
ncbi:hypothetical protein AB5I41_08295 [Sphingomonas sp. MMS24-JH45]